MENDSEHNEVTNIFSLPSIQELIDLRENEERIFSLIICRVGLYDKIVSVLASNENYYYGEAGAVIYVHESAVPFIKLYFDDGIIYHSFQHMSSLKFVSKKS